MVVNQFKTNLGICSQHTLNQFKTAFGTCTHHSVNLFLQAERTLKLLQNLFKESCEFVLANKNNTKAIMGSVKKNFVNLFLQTKTKSKFKKLSIK